MIEFREVINDCNLIELGYSEIKFTWCNRKWESSTISERLDRFLANREWCNFFPLCTTVAYSDHIPILLNMVV